MELYGFTLEQWFLNCGTLRALCQKREAQRTAKTHATGAAKQRAKRSPPTGNNPKEYLS